MYNIMLIHVSRYCASSFCLKNGLIVRIEKNHLKFRETIIIGEIDTCVYFISSDPVGTRTDSVRKLKHLSV